MAEDDLRENIRALLLSQKVLQKTEAKEIGYSEALVSIWLHAKIQSRPFEICLRAWLKAKGEPPLSQYVPDFAGLDEMFSDIVLRTIAAKFNAATVVKWAKTSDRSGGCCNSEADVPQQASGHHQRKTEPFLSDEEQTVIDQLNLLGLDPLEINRFAFKHQIYPCLKNSDDAPKAGEIFVVSDERVLLRTFSESAAVAMINKVEVPCYVHHEPCGLSHVAEIHGVQVSSIAP